MLEKVLKAEAWGEWRGNLRHRATWAASRFLLRNVADGQLPATFVRPNVTSVVEQPGGQGALDVRSAWGCIESHVTYEADADGRLKSVEMTRQVKDPYQEPAEVSVRVTAAATVQEGLSALALLYALHSAPVDHQVPVPEWQRAQVDSISQL